jgi:hypothetical protein
VCDKPQDPADGTDTCRFEFRPENVCEAGENLACQFNFPFDLPPDWEGTREEYCADCAAAWGMVQPVLDWWLIPVVLMVALVMGWCLTRWVELPGQVWLRGGQWSWTGSVTLCPSGWCETTLGADSPQLQCPRHCTLFFCWQTIRTCILIN